MLPPGLGSISGGAGGLSADLGGGPSGADGGTAGAGGQVFNFAPPIHVQEQEALKQTLTGPLMIVAALGAVWILARR
ncbi:hypothetical protein EHM94_05755 [Marinobacter sp. NP-6]|uniref:hypothetical protein n=1 Tax=Marinobacter sp. NP-6 TaxID=2488666 RepID=UPI000FCC3B92|nr:hypothetical protein [Marinobacter sp. NP-6]RUT74698.1 hypothetical protein EHM94_05755 [Marinobacter sp. NP-6]